MAKALAILLLALLAFSGGADAKRLKKVKVKRIESLAQTNASFPSISFVGGLELSDGNEHFGGWSGLATRDQGRSAVAVSDKGWWLTRARRAASARHSRASALSSGTDCP